MRGGYVWGLVGMRRPEHLIEVEGPSTDASWRPGWIDDWFQHLLRKVYRRRRS
jgi:hypothetical protein